MALEINDINAQFFSGSTIYSGGTKLDLLIESKAAQMAGDASIFIQNGLNTYTGGTMSNPTINISSATINTLVVSGSTSLNSLSATTIISDSTNIESIFKRTYQMCIPIQAEIPGIVTLTNQAVAEQFYGNNTRVIRLTNLSQFTQCRLTSLVTTQSASVNNPRLLLKGRSGAYSTTVTDYITLGVAGAEVKTPLSSATYVDSGWVTLNTTAVTGDIYIAVTQIGGNAAADPAIANVLAYFK